MNPLDLYKVLVPRANAWILSKGKQLTEFFQGLTGVVTDTKLYIDLIWLDIFPQTTRELDAWEDQWALPSTGLTEQERRDRLDGVWKAKGGQDPRYIQDTLQNAGFDVYVHEWWVPSLEPPVGVKECVPPRNPNNFLTNGQQAYRAACGEPIMQCGEPLAQCGERYNYATGYPLVNKISQFTKAFVAACGEPIMQCGEPLAQCGQFETAVYAQREYTIPSDPSKWPYFLYIGGETFPDLAVLPSSRREEFEDLCLKICPAHVWIGVMVTYVGDGFEFIDGDGFEFIDGDGFAFTGD